VLVVSAHPDGIELPCGAAVARPMAAAGETQGYGDAGTLRVLSFRW
jgi:LmbE family N-acetylglucosaminyl deacetylase